MVLLLTRRNIRRVGWGLYRILRRCRVLVAIVGGVASNRSGSAVIARTRVVLHWVLVLRSRVLIVLIGIRLDLSDA